MVEAIFTLFMSEQQAQSVLANPVIEGIFFVLFFGFLLAVFLHVLLYSKLRRIRSFVHETNSLNIAPLNRFQLEFEEKNKLEAVKVETFIQHKFSSWKMFSIPVVSLIKIIQMTVSLFILIGVLGTFIGLAMSLGSIDATGDQLVENIAFVLTGMDLAFYTSVTGMGFSLIMTILTRLMNTEYLLTDIMLKTEAYLEETEPDAMKRLIDVSEGIYQSINELRESNQQTMQTMVDSFHGFREYTSGLQQSAKDLAAFNKGLSANLKDFTQIFDHVKEITDGFGKATSKLNKNFDQLFSYFYKMDQRNEKMTSAFTETYHKIAELTTAQTESMNHFEQSVDDMRSFFTSIVERQQAIEQTFKRMNEHSQQLIKGMKENNEQFKRIFGEDVAVKLSEFNMSLRQFTSDFHTLGEAMIQFPDAIDMINKSQSEYKQLLTYRFDELKQFNHEIRNQLNGHSSYLQKYESFLGDVSRTDEQRALKNSQLLTDLHRTLTKLSDSYQRQGAQVELTITDLKDTLSKSALQVEEAVGGRLEKISRGIGEYIDQMNEAVKREFKQIADGNEESALRNSRALQQVMRQLAEEFQSLNRQLTLYNEDVHQQRERVRVATND